MGNEKQESNDLPGSNDSIIIHLRMELEQSQQNRRMEQEEYIHEIAQLKANNDKLTRQIKFLSEEEKAVRLELEFVTNENIKTKRKLEQENSNLTREKSELENALQIEQSKNRIA